VLLDPADHDGRHFDDGGATTGLSCCLAELVVIFEMLVLLRDVAHGCLIRKLYFFKLFWLIERIV